MPVCKKCLKEFPNQIFVNGKRKTLHKRAYCLECNPFGENSRSFGIRLTSGLKPVEINDIYGKLKVISRAEKPEHLNYDSLFFKCFCDGCGKESIMAEKSIRNSKTCGCSKKERTVSYNKTHVCKKCGEEKSIEEFGEFLVQKKDGRKFIYHKNKCRSCCVEDTIKWKNKNLEKSKEIQKKFKELNPDYHKSPIGKYSGIKSSAINHRGIEFLISFDEFMEMYYMPCHYCGGERPTHGLDRKDSNGPYSKENCVPCCKDCNYFKNINSYDVFLDKIKKISENLKDKNNNG